MWFSCGSGGTEGKRRTDCFTSESTTHKNEIDTSQPNGRHSPQELQSTVASFKVEVRHIKGLMQENDGEIGRTFKKKETCFKGCIDC